MIKVGVYISLAAIGALASILSPPAGAVSCILAYLLNPAAFTSEQMSFRYQLWVTIAFFIGYAIHRPRPLPRVGREGVVLISLWLFTTAAILSSAWAEVSSAQALDAVYELCKTVLVTSVIVLVVRSERDMSWLTIACIIGACHAAGLHLLGERLGYIGRGTPVLPDAQAPVMLLFFPVIVVTALLGRGKERLVCWLALPLVLDSIVTTSERAAFLGLVVEFASMIIILPKRLLFRWSPVALLGLALFTARFTTRDYWERVGSIAHPQEEASAKSRFLVNAASLRMFRDHPFGVGYGNYPDVSPRYLAPDLLTEGRRSAHNAYLALLCETGIPGVAAWLCAFGGAAWLLRRARKTIDYGAPNRRELYALGFEVALYGWFAESLTQNYHEADPAYWFVAFAVILTRLCHSESLYTDEAAEAVGVLLPEAGLK